MYYSFPQEQWVSCLSPFPSVTVQWWHSDVSVNLALHMTFIPNKKVQCADREILKT